MSLSESISPMYFIVTVLNLFEDINQCIYITGGKGTVITLCYDLTGCLLAGCLFIFHPIELIPMLSQHLHYISLSAKGIPVTICLLRTAKSLARNLPYNEGGSVTSQIQTVCPKTFLSGIYHNHTEFRLDAILCRHKCRNGRPS